MNDNRYIAPGVSVHAVNEYYRKTREAREEIQALQIWQGNRCLLRLAPYPYSCTDRREVYSLSKTFCSTAIGCAVDEGLLSVDDRIVDLFPDKLPGFISENLSKMKVRHVLSMSTGHAACVMPKMFAADDAARAFLAQEVPYEPGTHFAYNTGASCLLSAIIERVTGESAFDYLNRKVLYPIGIRDARWNICAEGINEGGIGMQVTIDDISRLGRLYLNRGVWEGKRLLSEEWIKEASSFHSDNSSNGTPDWQSGYGYQIWVNAREGYRGDGASGQLMIVCPERNITIAVQGLVPNMQEEMDLLWEFMNHLFDPDKEEALKLPDYTPAENASAAVPGENEWYRLDSNIWGWTSLHLTREEDLLTLDFSNGKELIRFTAGAGKYAFSEYTAAWRKPKITTLMDAHIPETMRTAAYYTLENGVCRIISRCLSDPHTEQITVKADGDNIEIRFALGSMLDERARALTGKKIS